MQKGPGVNPAPLLSAHRKGQPFRQDAIVVASARISAP